MSKLLLLLAFTFITITSHSQIFHSNSVKKRVQHSDLIIYGEVSELNSSWDKHHRNIYTSYKIKVFRVLKGTETKELTIIQKGGVVDDIWQNVSTSVDLEKGDIGFFMLKDFNENEKTLTGSFGKHIISGGYEGFVEIKDTSAFKLKSLPVTEEEITDFFLKRSQSQNKKIESTTDLNLKSTTTTHTITNISPLTSTSGTGSLLKIYGTGFGETQGSGELWFVDADNPNYIFTSNGIEIKLWTDTLIQVIIPSKAGTGNVRVKIGEETAVSSQILTLRYSVSDSNYKPVVLINANQTGGYTWQLNTELASNVSAANLVKKSIEQWICSTQIPWQIGQQTSATSGMDEICSISFGKLSEGLGEASSFNQAVLGSTGITEWVLNEVDITFSEDVNWGFSRSSILSTQHDFESTVLHELGHAHLLGHVNDDTDLMHYGILTGSFRDINDTNIECGQYIVNKSLNFSNQDFQTIVAPTQVAVGEAKTISGNSTVCGQESVTYSVPAIDNATSYIWTLPPGASGKSTTNSIDVIFGPNAVSGNITVRGSNSCSTGAPATLPVTVNEIPLTPQITLTENVLHSNASAGNQWYYENELIAGATGQDYVVSNSGDYYVVVTLSGCNSAVSNTINAVLTGIEDINANQNIRVFPNPTKNEIAIEFKGNTKKLNFEILNTWGQVVFKDDMVDNTKVQTTNFLPGLYSIKFNNCETCKVSKFIKQ